MSNYEDHLDQIEEDAYAKKYAQKMVEACVLGIVEELAEHHHITPQEVIKAHANTIKKIAESVRSLSGGLLSKELGVNLSSSIENLSYRLQDVVPPREAEEVKQLEETIDNPKASDLQVDEASAVQQAIQDVEAIGTATESPELDELRESGRQAARVAKK